MSTLTKSLFIAVSFLGAGTLAQAAPTIVLNDGFEASDASLDANGWTETGGAWNLSTSGFGNPDNYAWSGSGVSATISKDTTYVIQSDDQFDLSFDLRRLENNNTLIGTLTASLFYNAGAGDVVLGSAQYIRDDYSNVWSEDVTVPTIVGTASSVGENLQVSFSFSGGNTTNARFGIDNVKIEAIPEPGTYALLAGMLALTSVMIRRRRA
ncbi:MULTISPECIES: PEP-CTERM sorting domain-containing protein [unclassified Lentimonas]|uniref:PEP-CTERM sorting domain-containing protein n=1 Tax=unclassified Lentimonas TaxID=2630993 RepID=UPI001327298B|nr:MULTISPECIES: PEP-CTERM sorting domain-containing protein [unclassified Lentimonas]CAA6677630.1 Unannotated [Lentimonas sp. CC4]CAA6684893.1 Unannotated [Lentimonas sp. CC6]CAA7077994.1 Unannotated [Lentimonas sp. CC4]CAA7169915.1 Unannotated [Lentimonas sp. CC21]CAA7180135.1 Unannotated [Lentimonas sp. CC8]